MEFNSSTDLARHLARYITCPSTIEVHCRRDWGNTPSRAVIRQFMDRHQKPRRGKIPDAEPEDIYDFRVTGRVRPEGRLISPLKVPVIERVEGQIRKSAKDLGPIASKIVSAVAEQFKITPDDILGDGRARVFVLARSVAVKLMSEVTFATGERRFSLTKIGQIMNRDHSTISHSIQQFSMRIERYPAMREIYEGLRGGMA